MGERHISGMKMNSKRWSTVRDFYEADGGKFAQQISELLPDELFSNSNVPSRVAAKVMLSLYNALKSKKKFTLKNIVFPGDSLDGVLTVAEAAEEWGVAVNNLKWYCRGIQSGGRKLRRRFSEDEARRSGKVWLIKRSAMVRLFGESAKMRGIEKASEK